MQRLHSVSQLQASPRGTLRVHSRILVGQLFIVPAVTEFLLRYPEIRVDLMLSNQTVDLVEQNIDVDIRIGKLLTFQQYFSCHVYIENLHLNLLKGRSLSSMEWLV